MLSTLMTDESPILSVCILSFNQRDFISVCLDSILNQQTDFPFEVIVSDDASTDGTQDVIRDYKVRYPHLKIMLHQKNMGRAGLFNALECYASAKGVFLATFDGDDYMLPGKLQKQVDFMRSRLDYAICGHNVRVVNSSDDEVLGYMDEGKRIGCGDINAIAKYGTYLGAASIVYRREWLDLDLFLQLHSYRLQGDWLLHLIVARHGKVGYIDDVLSVYRKHDAGVTHADDNDFDKMKAILAERLDILEKAKMLGATDLAVDQRASELHFLMAGKYLAAGLYSAFQHHLKAADKMYPPQNIRNRVFILLRYAPQLLRRVDILIKFAKRNSF